MLDGDAATTLEHSECSMTFRCPVFEECAFGQSSLPAWRQRRRGTPRSLRAGDRAQLLAIGKHMFAGTELADSANDTDSRLKGSHNNG